MTRETKTRSVGICKTVPKHYHLHIIMSTQVSRTPFNNIFRVRAKFLGDFSGVPGEENVSVDTFLSSVLVKNAQRLAQQKGYC